MSQGDLPPPVTADELLARFVLRSGWFRPQTNTVRQDAFIPPANRELSVTRLMGLEAGELWELGRDVARMRAMKLYGSAEIKVADVQRQGLDVRPTATPRNHANIAGWPHDKPSQKAIALELAAVAKFVSVPAGEGYVPPEAAAG